MESTRKAINFGVPAYISQSVKNVNFYWRHSEYRPEAKVPTLPASKSKYIEYHKLFTRAAKAEPLEYGVYSACDALVSSWADDLGSELGVIVQSIYLESAANKVNLLALIKAISMLDYERLHPHGSMIALASLSHKDLEVVEAGIRAYEHWGRNAGILALKNAEARVSWLDEYRLEVIEYLESLK
ncbi:hypothetical protein L0Y47_13205 [Ectopseudomonas composti]